MERSSTSNERQGTAAYLINPWNQSNHGFDRTLKLVSTRREEAEIDDGQVSS
jgi:hypothetical protein